MKKICLIFFLFPILLLSNEDMTSLLSDLAQKADLSNQTKKESAGFLIVYTRQDLDRMKVHYLKDIIDQIPFARYNEDNKGMTNPFYTPHQPESPDAIRVYINDRELISPFSGNILKLFGQMSMGYIDHIEIYMGVPSQTLGIQPAWITIKCYTKVPDREETNLIGIQAGSYGTKELYGYSAKHLSDFSYLAYLDSRDLDRKTIYYKNNPLSKDKEITNFYGEIDKGNFKLEMQAIKGSVDNFIGDSVNFDLNQNSADFDYFYTGIYYNNNDFKAFINYSTDQTEHHVSSKTYLGAIKLPNSPLYTFKNTHIKFKEEISNAQIYKIFRTEQNRFLIGIQSRYKHFDIKDMSFGNVQIQNSIRYDREFILSGFLENNYMINGSNLITSAVKYDKNFENGDIKDYDAISGRLGYIYNNGDWISKTFIFYSETTPSMRTLFTNRTIFHQKYDPKKERKTSIGTKLIKKIDKHKISLLVGRVISDNSIYFDGKKFKNLNYTYLTDGISFRDTFAIDPLNKIIFNGWADFTHKKGTSLNGASKCYGGYITLFNTFGKFSFYNNLIYKHWVGIDDDGWNLNSTISYRYSRKLSLFVKGENIFNKALKSNYFSKNPLTGTTNYLNDIDTMDKRVWIGLEYQF